MIILFRVSKFGLIVILCFLVITGTTNAEINGQFPLDETNPNSNSDSNSEVREKHVPELDIIQNRNHRNQNNITPVQR